MAKKDKAAKASGLPETHEEAVAALEAKVAERRAARKKLEKFATDNKLNAKKDHSDDKKHGKAYAELRAPWAKAKEEEKELEELVKSLKPASNGNAKYEYPADVTTAEEKKKYRAAQRAKAKKAEKGETAEKPAKDKKSDKAEKSEKAEKKGKKEVAEEEAAPVKKKKKKAVSSDED